MTEAEARAALVQVLATQVRHHCQQMLLLAGNYPVTENEVDRVVGEYMEAAS